MHAKHLSRTQRPPCRKRTFSLGRSLGKVVATLEASADVIFVSIEENVQFEGRPGTQTKVMTSMFTQFADVERDLIAERTRESPHGQQDVRIPGGSAGCIVPGR